MKIHTNDLVKIITGKDKGKTGKVLKTYEAKNKVLVEGVHVVKRHVKPGAVSKEGGIISLERPIHMSNVMVIDGKGSKPTKIGYKVVDGKKYRMSKASGDVLETK